MRRVVIAGVALGCLSMMLSGCKAHNERWARSTSRASPQFLCDIVNSTNPPSEWEIQAKKEIKRRGLSCADYPVRHNYNFDVNTGLQD